MRNINIEAEVIKTIKKIKPEISQGSKKNFINNYPLDSMDIILTVSDLEKKFKIKIDASEILPTNFSSIKKISYLVKKN